MDEWPCRRCKYNNRKMTEEPCNTCRWNWVANGLSNKNKDNQIIIHMERIKQAKE